MGDTDRVVRELIARGAYDPDARDAADRRKLVDFLVGLGATADDIAAAGDELARVATDLILRGEGERFTRAEFAQRAGVTEETAVHFWRAIGLPDPGPDALAFSDEDVEALRSATAAVDLLGADAAFQLIRVIGSSLARIADAEVGAFLTNVGGPLFEADPSGLELARANATAAVLLRGAGQAIDVALRRHVEAAQRPLMVGSQDTIQVAVGFADLVGSTALAQDLPFAELGSLIAEFEARSIDTIVGIEGRAVKFIGDEVMFAVSDPAAGCEIALRLAEQFSGHARLPAVRVGLAFGDVLTRDGDYFGPAVNLAARIVKRGAPNESLVSAAVATKLGGSTEYAFTSRGTTHLAGIREPEELFTLERHDRRGNDE